MVCLLSIKRSSNLILSCQALICQSMKPRSSSKEKGNPRNLKRQIQNGVPESHILFKFGRLARLLSIFISLNLNEIGWIIIIDFTVRCSIYLRILKIVFMINALKSGSLARGKIFYDILSELCLTCLRFIILYLR